MSLWLRDIDIALLIVFFRNKWSWTSRTRLFGTLCLLILGVSTPLLSQETLSLEQAVRRSLKNNWDIVIAHSDAEISRAANTWGAVGAYPSVSAGGSASTAQVSIDQKFSNGTVASQAGVHQSTMQAFVSLNWKVFDGMKMFATKSRLEQIEKSGELRFKNRVSQTVFDVSLNYYSLVRLHQQRLLTKEVLNVLSERLTIASKRFEVGISAKSDVLQAQIDINEQRASLLGIDKSIRQAEISLCQLMRTDSDTTFACSDSIVLNSTLRADELEQSTYTNNFSVLLSQQDLAVALQTRREIYSQGLPSISVSGGYLFNRSDNSAGFSLFNQSDGFNAGVNLAIPLFNGFSTQTQLDVEALVIRKNEQTIDAVRSRVRSSYRNALSEFQSALAMVPLLQSNVVLARQNNDIAIERFRRQTITTVELRQIQLAILESSTSLLNAQFNAKAAELELLLLAGRLSYNE